MLAEVWRGCSKKGCVLMCKQPAMRAPFNGCSAAYFSRVAMRPGILQWSAIASIPAIDQTHSCSANSISRRPKAANEISATFILLAGADILNMNWGYGGVERECTEVEEWCWRERDGESGLMQIKMPALLSASLYQKCIETPRRDGTLNLLMLFSVMPRQNLKISTADSSFCCRNNRMISSPLLGLWLFYASPTMLKRTWNEKGYV